ncbi:MAG: hypothetical protein GC199_11630 [Alphaproteobacteria bacterium]|nr:hypothetical protein [Alphaproteobacteria bacterium]
MRRFRVRPFAFLIAAALAAGAAHAQSPGAPRQIIPVPSPRSEPPPPSEPAPPASPYPQSGPTPYPPASAPSGFEAAPLQTIPGQAGAAGAPSVEVGTLDSVDNSAVGLLSPDEGGLGSDLWQGSSRATIAALLATMPVATRSPAVNALGRRVLLSGGSAPRGARQEGASLIELRIDRLAAAGENAAIGDLVARLVEPSEAVRRKAVDALLLEGRDDLACGDASALRLASNDPYWLMVRAYCYAVEGNAPGVSLTLELMKNFGEGDPVVEALAVQIAEGFPAKISTYRSPSPLGLAFFRLADVTLPADVLKDAEPGELSSIARLHTASRDIQLAAAEGAAHVGAIDPKELIPLYAALSFKEKLFANVAGSAAALTTPEANALFYQSVVRAKTNAGKVAALSAALRFARTQGAFTMLAQVYGKAAAEILPATDHAAEAPEIVRALLLAGERARARDWTNVIADASQGEGEILNAAEIRLAVADPNALQLLRTQQALSWLVAAATTRAPGDPVLRRVELEVGIMDALGFPVPGDVRAQVLQGPLGGQGFIPTTAVMTGLPAASSENRVGETALYALAGLGQLGPAASHPQTIATVVRALKLVGLEADARAIALEALLARPFGSTS